MQTYHIKVKVHMEKFKKNTFFFISLALVLFYFGIIDFTIIAIKKNFVTS